MFGDLRRKNPTGVDTYVTVKNCHTYFHKKPTVLKVNQAFVFFKSSPKLSD